MNDWQVFSLVSIPVFLLFLYLKHIIWDNPRDEIKRLKNELSLKESNFAQELAKLHESHTKKLGELQKRHNDGVDFMRSKIDASQSEFKLSEAKLNSQLKRLQTLLDEALTYQYKYEFLMILHPELDSIFKDSDSTVLVGNTEEKLRNLFWTLDTVNKYMQLSATSQAKQLFEMKKRLCFFESTSSNLTAIPYMAKIMADYETSGIEKYALELDWGSSIQRQKKVKSIREIRKEAQALIEAHKEAEYQLAYLLNLFPVLEDVIDCEFSELPTTDSTLIEDSQYYDEVTGWLSKEEYRILSTAERNQLALDRYKASRKKSKWQIGRDYELYVGFRFSRKGYNVDYFGSYMKLEDLGRDLVAKKDDTTLIIQCKYWSSAKQIHEKHITQLYGTTISYCIENKLPKDSVTGILITNISLSDTAKRMADYLGIKYKEYLEVDDYPCIKCNIGHDEYGNRTKIYHLPFDQQYDATKINSKGEFFAMTVEEAERAGFRRARKWFSEG